MNESEILATLAKRYGWETGITPGNENWYEQPSGVISQNPLADSVIGRGQCFELMEREGEKIYAVYPSYEGAPALVELRDDDNTEEVNESLQMAICLAICELQPTETTT